MKRIQNLHDFFYQLSEFQKKTIDLMTQFRNESPSLISFFIYFVFIVLIRSFLEFIYSENVLDFDTFFHIFGSFLWVATSIMVLTKRFFPKENIENIAKIIFMAMTIILLPPIIDLILSGGKGLNMGYYTDYIKPNMKVGFWKEFITFFGKYKGYGATPGIKIELTFGLSLGFFYSFFIQQKKIIPSLLYILLIYLVVVTLGFFPHLFTLLLSNFDTVFHYDHRTLGTLFFLVTLVNGLVLFFLNNPDLYICFFNYLKKSEIYYLLLMIALGIVSVEGFNEKITLNQFLFLRIILLTGILILISLFPTLKKSFPDPVVLGGTILILSLILAGYVSFLALFFSTIFLIDRHIQSIFWFKQFFIFKRVFHALGYIGIASLGRETFFPNSFLDLKTFLGILVFNLLWGLFKEGMIAKKLLFYFHSFWVRKNGGQDSLENSSSG